MLTRGVVFGDSVIEGMLETSEPDGRILVIHGAVGNAPGNTGAALLSRSANRTPRERNPAWP
ncbi:MAG: hypothetical protein RQ729_13070, partial [Wenzhouxiangellaceae bacterium]|nr:hypothetical protein [Wenzhouxiangellaceae bacterium]